MNFRTTDYQIISAYWDSFPFIIPLMNSTFLYFCESKSPSLLWSHSPCLSLHGSDFCPIMSKAVTVNNNHHEAEDKPKLDNLRWASLSNTWARFRVTNTVVQCPRATGKDKGRSNNRTQRGAPWRGPSRSPWSLEARTGSTHRKAAGSSFQTPDLFLAPPIDKIQPEAPGQKRLRIESTKGILPGQETGGKRVENGPGVFKGITG